MILIINTADKNYLEVIIASEVDNYRVKKITGEYKQAEQLLPTIEKLLAESDKSLSDITGLGVVSGPGGFTALRIGVVTANTLAFAFNIPVVGINLDQFENYDGLVKTIMDKLKTAKAGEIVLPEYGREPNIS